MSEMEWLDIFGDNLVSMLQENRMTQKELADACGLSEGTISAYIHKKKLPGVKALINMADVFCCSLDDLMFFGDRIEG